MRNISYLWNHQNRLWRIYFSKVNHNWWKWNGFDHRFISYEWYSDIKKANFPFFHWSNIITAVSCHPLHTVHLLAYLPLLNITWRTSLHGVSIRDEVLSSIYWSPHEKLFNFFYLFSYSVWIIYSSSYLLIFSTYFIILNLNIYLHFDIVNIQIESRLSNMLFRFYMLIFLSWLLRGSIKSRLDTYNKL